MPREVLAIIDVIGNHARTEILRRLAHSPRSAVDLAAELEVAHSSVHRHLLKLEEQGLVEADVDPGQRRGRKTVIWRTVPERVAELGQLWIGYASGTDGEPDKA